MCFLYVSLCGKGGWGRRCKKQKQEMVISTIIDLSLFGGFPIFPHSEPWSDITLWLVITDNKYKDQSRRGVEEEIMEHLLLHLIPSFKKEKKKKFTSSNLCKTNWTINPNLVISKDLEFKGTENINFMNLYVYNICKYMHTFVLPHWILLGRGLETRKSLLCLQAIGA